MFIVCEFLYSHDNKESLDMFWVALIICDEMVLFLCVQVRSLDTQLHPERLKVITQQVEEEQALLQSQTLLRLQQIHGADRQTHSPQVRNAHA